MPRRAQRSLSFVDRHELERRATPRRNGGRTRDQAAQARSDALCVLRSARRAARQDAGGVGGRTAMRAGVTMTSTLLAKDTSHRTVFDVFSAGGGMGVGEMAGAGNFVMVADPSTFRVLPWAGLTTPAGCCATSISRTASRCRSRRGGSIATRFASSRQPASTFSPGSKSSSNCSSLIDPKLSPDGLTWPAEAPAVEHTTHGFQYLTESRFDQVDPILEVLRKTMRHWACRCCRSKSSSVRASTSSPSRRSRAWRRRHHGAVSQRHEAGGAAARLSRELHVPAEIAQHVCQRLASAPVAAGSQIRPEPARLQR